MKLHLPRLLFAALLAAFVSAPAHAAEAQIEYTTTVLSDPSQMGTFHDNHGNFIVYLREDLVYSYGKIETPFTETLISGGNLVFTTYLNDTPAELSFTVGKVSAVSKVNNLTFDNLENLHFASIASGADNARGYGAIYMEGTADKTAKLTISNIRDGASDIADVVFLNNSAGAGSAINGKYADIVMVNNENILISGNWTTEADWGSGGAICADDGSLTIQNNSSVKFSTNKTKFIGGAITAFDLSAVTINNNGAVNFTGNKAETDDGGAIYASLVGKVSLDGNASVTFSGNEAGDRGGAIYSVGSGAVSLSRNGSITFENNKASAGKNSDDFVVGGGAIYTHGGSVSINDNTGPIKFSANESGYAGGAIGIENNSNYTAPLRLTISGNKGEDGAKGSIIFENNKAGVRGGAICMDEGSIIEINDNYCDITFEKNEAGVAGGAIFQEPDSFMEINGNQNVVFRQNIARDGSSGAIYGSNLSIRNNEGVLFEKNVKVDQKGDYILQSLLLTSYSDDVFTVNLSAAEGKKIEFHDSIYIVSNSTFNLNAAYKPEGAESAIRQDGAIIFTGATTIDDLKEVKGTDGTAYEILESRTSTVESTTHVYGGLLSVESSAIFRSCGIDLKEQSGATLRIADAKVVNIDTRANTVVGTVEGGESQPAVHLSSGTTLEISGRSTIEGGKLVFSDNSNWNVHLTKSNAEWNTAALTLSQGVMDIGGKLTLSFDIKDSTFNDTFCLFYGSGESYANISEKWTQDNIKVVGTGDAKGATFDDLYWRDGALYYDSTLVWSNGDGTGLWTENEDKNWLNDRSFHSGANTKFTDKGKGGEVTLAGKIVSTKVTVDASVDYTFTGTDENAGFRPGTNIVKRGEGSLTLDVATEQDGTNDYGRVSLEEGTLKLHDDNALGGSVLKTAEGTTLAVGDASHVVLQDNQLQATDHDIKGDVVVAKGSSLEIASGSYTASSSTVDGELIFNGQVAREAGSLSGSGSLEVTNGASVTFKDASGFTGNVNVTGSSSSFFLKVVDSFLKAGEIAVSAGDLTLRASEQLTMAGGSVLSMVAGAAAEKVTTVLADKVIEFAGNAMLAAMMNSMLGDLNKDGILNESVGGAVGGAGITLNAGSTLKLENCHINLSGTSATEGSTLTLNVTPTNTEKINLVLMPDDILTEDSMVLLFSGVDKVNFVYDDGDTLISGSGCHEYDANHYFSGSMVGAGTKLVFDGSVGTVYLKGLVPEPTTATLSLLALAALATRRRRR